MISPLQAVINDTMNFTKQRTVTLITHVSTPKPSDNKVIQSMIPVFVFIAVVALFGNLLVVFLFIRNREWLKKAHSHLILTLAVTDILTAICILCVPLLIHESDVYSVPSNETLRELYCRVVWSHYLVFSLGVTSVYLCLSLAIERWLAVKKPHFYKRHLNSKWIVCVLVVIPWFAGFAFESSAIIRTTGAVLPDGTTSCRWNPDTSGWGARVAIAVFSFCGMILIPGILVVVAYVDILVSVKVTFKRQSVWRGDSQKHVAKPDFKRITLMAGLASMVLLICWIPNQFYFMLSQMGYLRVHIMPHRWLNVLALSSSGWNPIIYCFSNPQYREGFKNELSRLLCVCKFVRERFSVQPALAPIRPHIATPDIGRTSNRERRPTGSTTGNSSEACGTLV